MDWAAGTVVGPLADYAPDHAKSTHTKTGRNKKDAMGPTVGMLGEFRSVDSALVAA
jgi:hypothetical protein